VCWWQYFIANNTTIRLYKLQTITKNVNEKSSTVFTKKLTTSVFCHYLYNYKEFCSKNLYSRTVNTDSHTVQFPSCILNLLILFPIFIIRAGNFTSKIFSAKISTEDCYKKMHELNSDQHPTVWKLTKLWSLDHLTGMVSGSFDAHCRGSGKTFIRSQRQDLFKTITSIYRHELTRLEDTLNISCDIQYLHWLQYSIQTAGYFSLF